MVSSDELQQVAVSATTGLPRAYDGAEWPDCFDSSRAVKQAIQNTYDVAESAVAIEEVILANEYRHYVVVVSREVISGGAVIDASFAQFAEEADTPIALGSNDEIEPVVVVSPKEQYVFF